MNTFAAVVIRFSCFLKKKTLQGKSSRAKRRGRAGMGAVAILHWWSGRQASLDTLSFGQRAEEGDE